MKGRAVLGPRVRRCGVVLGWVVVALLLGVTAPQSAAAAFPDVPLDHPHRDAILMHFSNWPGDWVITHVTNYTGLKVRQAPMDSWVTRLGTTYVKHIAAVGLGGEVLVFSRPETGDWQAADLSAATAVKVDTSAYRYAALGLAHWQTPSGSGTTDHLVGVGPAGEVLVFSSVNGSAWQVVNVSALTDTSVARHRSEGRSRHMTKKRPSVAWVKKKNEYLPPAVAIE